MSIPEVQEVFRDLITTALLVALPALAASLLVGIIISVVQTVTSIQDQTLTSVPRILILGLVLVLTLAFSLDLAVDFARRMILHAAGVGQ